MTNYWMENAFEAGKHTIVDIGPLNDQAARDRADKLFEHVSRRNLMIAGGVGRILMRIPPTKVKKVLLAFPEITAKCTYSWCTHSWLK